VGQPDRDDEQHDRDLRITIRLFTLADSRMPMTRMVDISATMITAGRLTSAPVMFRPVWAHPATPLATFSAVHQAVGALVRLAGRWIPKLLKRLTRWPDQPTPTVAAPAAYSSTRSHPMIQAISSPMVAYE
jgi:hypothetical protein